MALLDRFRTSSPEKHPDPAVRLAYIEELPLDERDQIAEAAREDPDARVRRAAVAKLLDPSALASVARDDADGDVRAKATEMLRDVAAERFEGIGEGEAMAAVEAIGDPRALGQVAKETVREAVGRAALDRIREPRLLGSIARHAALEPIRMSALDALQDGDEIIAVAMNGEFRDAAAAAVDRISDRGRLEQVAARAKTKAAVKRARTLLREMDGAAEPAAEPELLSSDDHGLPVQAAADDAGAPAIAAEEGEAALADDEAGWASAEGIDDPELAARLANQTSRAAEPPPGDADRTVAVPDADEAARDAGRRHARLSELADEAEAAAAEQDLASARRRLTMARREWRDLAAGLAPDDAIAARFAAAEVRVQARGAEAHDLEAKARRDALTRLQQLAARLEPLATKPDLTLKAGERALRDVRAALADVPPLPSRHDFEEITHRLKDAQAKLSPKVQELREAEDWKRFANVAVQEQLIAKMEALRGVDDPETVAREIRELQQEWRASADVPRAQAEGLWRRFKTAHDEAWARCEAHFAAQAVERADNLAKKAALCERAESLAESTRWIETADEIKRLQAEWKTIGPVTRGQEKAVWERFRSACDRFFTRRHEDLNARKKAWAENLAKKEALCARAEALAESTEWDASAAEIKQLQAEWRTIGPVKKTRSDAVWQRFRGACDRFFDRYAHRHDVERLERVAAREAICAELEAMAASTDEADPATLLAQVRDIRRRWQQAVAARGVEREHALALERRFTTAFDAVVGRSPAAFLNTDLDPEANRKRMEGIVKRIEDLATSVGRANPAADESLSPTTRLAAMLKEALAANTIGGKVDDDSRWRAALEDVRQAQASWARLGPVSEEARRALADRFQRACRRISEAAGRRPDRGGTRPRA